MSQPKKKVSRSRRDIRRYASSNRLATPTSTTCSECGEVKRPHRVCACGHYDGKAVIAVKTKEKSAPAPAAQS